MGRVFTPEQVAGGLVPREGAHQLAARFILARIRSLDDLPSKEIACTVYGSTVTGNSTMRSDVDVFASVYKPDRSSREPTQNERYLHNILFEAEERYSVSVEANVVPEDVLFNGVDDTEDTRYPYILDPLYMRHIIDAQRRFPEFSHGKIPLDFYEEAPYDPHQEEYARLAFVVNRFGQVKVKHMRSALEQSYKENGEVDYYALQRALELPKSIARKAIALFGDTVGDVTSQQDMHGQLAKITPMSFVMPAQADLMALDAAYTDRLAATIQGDMSIAAYQAWLEAHNLPALELADLVATEWSERFATYATQVTQETGIEESELLGPMFGYEEKFEAESI